jgi:hypothetical protein
MGDAMPSLQDDLDAVDMLIRGFQVSRMLRAVADLDLADKVPANGSCELDPLAQECRVQSLPLLRILRGVGGLRHFLRDIGRSDQPFSAVSVAAIEAERGRAPPL